MRVFVRKNESILQQQSAGPYIKWSNFAGGFRGDSVHSWSFRPEFPAGMPNPPGTNEKGNSTNQTASIERRNHEDRLFL